MRSVVEAASDRELDTTDGVRVVEDDGRWVLVAFNETAHLPLDWQPRAKRAVTG